MTFLSQMVPVTKHILMIKLYSDSKDVPNYPPAESVAKYIEDYANYFELKSRCRMGVIIEHLKRTGEHWTIEFSQRRPDGSVHRKNEQFDKVVVTTGAFHKPNLPTCEGMDSYKGSVIHSQAFKE